MTPEIIYCDDFVAEATTYILQQGRRALRQKGAFRLALCGGNTPRPVYEALATDPKAMDWSKVWMTFGDERCVPPDDDESNYRMAREAMLDKLPLDPDQVLRIAGEKDPDQAAREYETRLKKLAQQAGDNWYRHDLLLLGMGDDGHTASLFPNSPALSEMERWVVANYVDKFKSHRITMTYPLINRATRVCFMVNGADKKRRFEQIISGDRQFPSARVTPLSGNVTWLVRF